MYKLVKDYQAVLYLKNGGREVLRGNETEEDAVAEAKYEAERRTYKGYEEVDYVEIKAVYNIEDEDDY